MKAKAKAKKETVEQVVEVSAGKFSKKGGVIERRKRVIERLEAQLKSGKKPSNETATFAGPYQIPLEEKDTKRIKREIAVLKKRI